MNVKQKRYPRFDGYTGGTVWSVRHPEHGAVDVLAPSVQAAIVVAAGVWGCDWKAISFYCDCVVKLIGRKAKLADGGTGAV